MAKTLAYFSYPTIFGVITLQASQTGLTKAVFGKEQLEGSYVATSILNTAATQVQEYFAGKRYRFATPLDIAPTAFQKQVWDELEKIPYGETRSSAQIAEALGNAAAFRSVGRAVRENPVVLFIPSQRIEVPASSTFKLADVFRGIQAFERSVIE